jgi:hypothetical protein
MKIRIGVILFAIIVGGLSGLYAQTTNDTAPIPASQKDIQANTKQLGELGKKVDKTTKAVEVAGAQSAATKKAVETGTKEAVKAVDESQKKNAEAVIAAKDEIKNGIQEGFDRQMIVTLSVVGILGIIVLGLVVVMHRKKNTSQIVVERIVQTEHREEPKKDVTSGILRDPDIDSLKKFSVSNGGLKDIPFMLVVGTHEYLCTAHLLDGQEPMVTIEGDSEKVIWKNRRKRAAKIYGLTLVTS